MSSKPRFNLLEPRLAALLLGIQFSFSILRVEPKLTAFNYQRADVSGRFGLSGPVFSTSAHERRNSLGRICAVLPCGVGSARTGAAFGKLLVRVRLRGRPGLPQLRPTHN